MDWVKKGAAAVGRGIDRVGQNLTNTITYEKLLASWKIAGSPTDSEEPTFPQGFVVELGRRVSVLGGESEQDLVDNHTMTDHDSLIRLEGQILALTQTVEAHNIASVERDTRIEAGVKTINGKVAEHEGKLNVPWIDRS